MRLSLSFRIWLVVIVVTGTVFTPAQASFLVTDCSDTASTGVPLTECRALESLWGSTHRPGWNNADGWDTNTPINTWYGIVVTGGNVTGIQLSQNNLVGSIPPILSDLERLQSLSLDHNQLTGPIPIHLARLNDLSNLVLTSNQLSGDIPDFSGMVSLNNLYFDQNQFEFSDFEPEYLAYKAKLDIFVYGQQDPVDIPRSRTVVSGESLAVSPIASYNPDGDDHYQWYKDGIVIPQPEGTKRHFGERAAQVQDAGEYTYTVTNSLIDSMTLVSHKDGEAIVVSVDPQINFSVSGSISGLDFNSLITLQNNKDDELPRESDGLFEFETTLKDGATYSVSVATQPFGKICSVSNGSGTITAADVTDVVVDCMDFVPSTCPHESFDVVDQADLDEEWYVGDPRISGNGKVVVYECGDDICIKDFSTTPPMKEVVKVETGGFNLSYHDPSIDRLGNVIYFTDNSGTSSSGRGYTYDRRTGIKKVVTVDIDGYPATTDNNYNGMISGNGKFVVFNSSKENLVDGDNNGRLDVFRRDLETNETILVSVSSSGQQGNSISGWSEPIAINYTGNVIAFGSDADNLISDDTNDSWDVFVRDISAGTTRRIGLTTSGAELYYGSSFPGISYDGTVVTFSAYPEDRYPADQNSGFLLYAYDLESNTIELVAPSATGNISEGHVPDPSSDTLTVSSDGGLVFFSSKTENLVEGDENGGPFFGGDDIFVRNRETEQTLLLSYTPDANGDCVRVDNMSNISASVNGGFIVFSVGGVVYRVALDITPPVFRNMDITPTRGVNEDVFMFSARIHDDNAYIETEFRINDGLWQSVPFKTLYAKSWTVSKSFDVAGLEAGTHSLCLKATDGYGNVNEQCKPFIILAEPDFQPFSLRCRHSPILPSPGEDVSYRAEVYSASGKQLIADWIEIWVNDKTAPVYRRESDIEASRTLPATGDYNTYGCRAGLNGEEVFSGWRLHATDTYDASHAIPIIKTGEPENRIDVVFVADSEEYSSATQTEFLEDVGLSINEGYFGEAWFRDNQKYFNFWLAREQGWADHPDNPEKCQHLLPGQLPDDPDTDKDIWQKFYAFSDVAAIIHRKQNIDCAIGSPASFGSRTFIKTSVFRHESGHRPFGLADEYSPKGGHYERSIYPNNYETEITCNADLARLNDDANECISFETNSGKTFWRSDPADDHLMRDKGKPRAADLRRMNWLIRRCKEGDC